MYTQPEAELRARAAEYAAALLVERPELCQDEQMALQEALDDYDAIDSDFVGQIETLMNRDDEDTDETARLIFEALAR